MVHLCLIVRTDSDWGVEKRCQQVLLDVFDIGSVILQAVKNILDVQAIQLHQPAFHDFPGLIVSGNADFFFSGAASLSQDIQDSFERFLLGRMVQNQDVEL